MAGLLRQLQSATGNLGLIAALILIAGCSHSGAKAAKGGKVSGSPEALNIVTQLQAMDDEPPAISGTFTWQTTQDQASHFAERVFYANPPLEYLSAVYKTPSTQPAETIALRNYVEQTLKDGPPEGIYTEVQQCEQRQQGKLFYVACEWQKDGRDYQRPAIMAWDGRCGIRYDPTLKQAVTYTDRKHMMNVDASPSAVRSFSSHMPFPTISGSVTLRQEVVDGEDLVVLREDLGQLYRDYYLSAKEGYAPRRIVQRGKQETKMPEHDVTCTIETETSRWPHTWPFKQRTTRQFTVPAAPLKLLDWNHNPWDSDTTITACARRPDGKWFVTQSTTVYPFLRRSETFKAENLSFAPLPASSFEVQLPPDVSVRR